MRLRTEANLFIGNPDGTGMTAIGKVHCIQIQTCLSERGYPLARYLHWKGALIEVPVQWSAISYRFLVMLAVAYAEQARN